MWVITYKGKPATLDTLDNAEPGGMRQHRRVGDRSYIAAPTKRECVALYLDDFGFTWKERDPGTDCRKVILKPD